MIKKIVSILIAILGAWMYLHDDPIFGVILVFTALLIYRHADFGVSVYSKFDASTDSNSSSGSDGDSGGD